MPMLMLEVSVVVQVWSATSMQYAISLDPGRVFAAPTATAASLWDKSSGCGHARSTCKISLQVCVCLSATVRHSVVMTLLFV